MLTRRHVLRTLVVAAGTLPAASLLSGCGSDSGRKNAVADDGKVFPQSVASGDPRASSVVLWTRVGSASGSTENLDVLLVVSTREDFSNPVVATSVQALGVHDHCVKVRVTDLSPSTTYYYRFEYAGVVSRTGRTRTAPAADSNESVRFAWVSCQDYLGRYYNAYLAVLEQDPDFVIHVGDYIYETEGDPLYQAQSGSRSFRFSSPSEALRVKPATGDAFLAANSLGNYRDLYKTVRSDVLMQRVHERYAFINTWDDHEFTDDSWQENGTYFDAATGEASVDRKRNAEQAFFEYIPIDHESVAGDVGNSFGELAVNESNLYPSTRIYRDFRFGKNLHVFVTDNRSYRPDHLIPEDAFPGTVVIDQPSLEAFLPTLGLAFSSERARYAPYVNIDDPIHASRRQAMRSQLNAAYITELQKRQIDPVAMQGTIDRWVDVATTGFVAASVVNEYATGVSPFTQDQMDAMPRGLAYVSLFKSSLFADIGAHYFVVKPVFDVYAAWLESQGIGTGSLFGEAQQSWLDTGLRASDATWKVVVTAISTAPMIFDLDSPPLPFVSGLYNFIPQNLKQPFYFFVDQWDGFPAQRKAFIERLSEVGAIAISGDVHSTFVTEYPASPITGKRAFDFTAPAISSATNADFGYIAADTINASMKFLVPSFDSALMDATDPAYRNGILGRIKYSNQESHGMALMNVSASRVAVTFRLMPSSVRDAATTKETRKYYEESFYDRSAEYLALGKTVNFNLSADGTLTKL